MRLVQYGDKITRVRILSCSLRHESRSHRLLLTVNVGELLAVKSGFSSGYLGEGPSGLSFVLKLLRLHDADIEEYDVNKDFCERLDTSSLTNGDIDILDASRPIRPTRWYDYLVDNDWDRGERGTLWQEFPPVMPLAIIDSRISDLALKFLERPDEILLTGYRRLEDMVRKRTRVKKHGVKLFSEAFIGDKAKLGWGDVPEDECIGRGNLFTAAYMAYRNPRAHRELKLPAGGQLMEFLLLNHLFVLEKESVERISDAAEQPQKKVVGNSAR